MKIKSKTKQLVLAILFNILIFPILPALATFVVMLIVTNIDSLSSDQLKTILKLITLCGTLITEIGLVVSSIFWSSKWFTFETVPLAKKRWAHVVWVVALCIISGLVGFSVWSSILS